MSVLRMVLEPYPTTTPHPGNHDDSVLYSVTYGRAMVDVLLLTPFGQHDIGNDSNKHGVELSEKSGKMKHSSSFRRLWVWINSSDFEEGYENLQISCQKEMDKRVISINCFSLEGQLAKLELIGLGTFQLLQKVLHAVGRFVI
ncbi:Glutamate receptor 3.2 isoform E [Glycine soja]|uniref:Glutamate receptor 3.2 isoform E n=1 Tax=Glycine soja TaxID=3848 RepID=A0A445KTG9_GLYSO|nr:Glutamate receptor 3.2 isoform E [Glycine soja]